MQHGIAVAEIGIERRQRGEFAPDGIVRQVLNHELFPPSDYMRPCYVAELLRMAQAREGHKVFDVLPVGPARICIGEVVEPFDLRRHLRQGLELGCERARSSAAAGSVVVIGVAFCQQVGESCRL